MSKAAWGCLQKNGNQLMIRHFEIGVLFLPKTKQLKIGSKSEETTNSINFHLPYEYQKLSKFQNNSNNPFEQPWIWDKDIPIN